MHPSHRQGVAVYLPTALSSRSIWHKTQAGQNITSKESLQREPWAKNKKEIKDLKNNPMKIRALIGLNYITSSRFLSLLRTRQLSRIDIESE